eukprot:5031766-Lingulodinium_polyedra.AAC.1
MIAPPASEAQGLQLQPCHGPFALWPLPLASKQRSRPRSPQHPSPHRGQWGQGALAARQVFPPTTSPGHRPPVAAYGGAPSVRAGVPSRTTPSTHGGHDPPLHRQPGHNALSVRSP